MLSFIPVSEKIGDKFLFSVNQKPVGVVATVRVSRSISGTACCPMILIMTAREYSWTGSSSPHAVYAGQL